MSMQVVQKIGYLYRTNFQKTEKKIFGDLIFFHNNIEVYINCSITLDCYYINIQLIHCHGISAIYHTLIDEAV